MIINLKQNDIREISAEGLILPVDGYICKLGGAAATALKQSFPPESRKEFIADLEEMLQELKPIPNGQAKILDLNHLGITSPWRYLIVSSVLPHHVNDCILNKTEFSQCLTQGIISGLRVCAENKIKSIACTTIADSYRLSSGEAIRNMVMGFKPSAMKPIEIFWCFVDQNKLNIATQECIKAELPIINPGKQS